MELGSFQWCTAIGPEAMGTYRNTGDMPEHWETLFRWEGGQALAQVAQESCGDSILRDTQKPSRCGPGYPALGGLVEAWELD